MELRERLIISYFRIGLTFKEIIIMLAIKHGIITSERTVKRITNRLGLFRYKAKSDILEVAMFIHENTETSGQLHGYRWMYRKCIQSGYIVSQEEVRCLLAILDPVGVEIRKRKRLRRRRYFNSGPNFIWHIDGYDKLKPFGIAIHGCVDGFSRHIIWLRAGYTNNDPRVIAFHYINAVERAGGCPMKIRADRGTENRHIEQMQIFLRRNHVDQFAGEDSFLYGNSTHNQRIEWFWGLLRKEHAQYWMDIFGVIKEELDAFSGDFVDKSLIQFCFVGIIQRELNEVASVWDTHRLQKKKNVNHVTGKPCILYNAPEIYEKENKLCEIDVNDIEVCREEIIDLPDTPCDKVLYDLCCILMEEQGWDFPFTAEDGILLYMKLRNSVKNLLRNT